MNIFGKELLEDCETTSTIKSKKRNIYFPGLVTSHITISRIKLNVSMAHIKIAVHSCIVSITSFNKPGKFMGTLFSHNLLISILLYILAPTSSTRAMKCNIISLLSAGS